MSPEKSNASEQPKESRRIALHTKTTLRFTHFEGFVTEYSANLSMTGMFIRSDNPQEPGTVVDFEFKVADGLKLIQGRAEVVWARYDQESADRPPGMGIRFLELDNESKRLIRWIVERHVYEGGKPFELEDLRSVVDETLAGVEQEPKTPAAAPIAAVERPSLPPSDYVEPSFAQSAKEPAGVVALRWGGIAAAAVALLLIGAKGVPWLMESVERSTTTAAAAGPSDPASAGADGASSAGNANDGTETASDGVEGEAADEVVDVGSADWSTLTTTVESWASAWSEQNVEQYLSYYASSFVPPRGMSRGQWESSRRERLSAPSFINVGVANLEIETVGPESARAVFSQNYRSNTFSDTVQKTLDLVWEEGDWKIADERS